MGVIRWLYLLEGLLLLGLGCPPVLQVQVILLLLLVFPGVLHCHALKLLQINLQCMKPQLWRHCFGTLFLSNQ